MEAGARDYSEGLVPRYFGVSFYIVKYGPVCVYLAILINGKRKGKPVQRFTVTSELR